MRGNEHGCNRGGKRPMSPMRKLSLIAAAMLSAALCTGCAVESNNCEEPVTLSIWHVYGGQTDSPLNDLIDTFNNTVGKEEGIQVEVTMVSNNKNIHDDVISAASHDPDAADLPDIFVAYPKTVLALPDENTLVDYRDYFSEEELAAFVPEFIEDGTVNGRLTCLPVTKSTEFLFVNKTAFDRFSAATGAELSDLSTWEGLFSTCIAYEEWTDAQTPDIADDGKAFLAHDFHFNYFQVGVESLGGDFFAEDKVSFNSTFKRVWDPYAKAGVAGGLWLQDGYGTEPMRTGEVIASIASSAGVLYFSDEVIHSDNTTEDIEFAILPCPTFEDGSKLVMQRGAGMCVTKSTPEREQAAVEFLKWLTEPARNTKFAVSTGYMPVVTEAYETCLPQSIETLSEKKYVALYQAYLETLDSYSFYVPPQTDSYLATETSFEENVRRHLLSARNDYRASGSSGKEAIAKYAESSYEHYRESQQRL